MHGDGKMPSDSTESFKVEDRSEDSVADRNAQALSRSVWDDMGKERAGSSEQPPAHSPAEPAFLDFGSNNPYSGADDTFRSRQAADFGSDTSRTISTRTETGTAWAAVTGGEVTTFERTDGKGNTIVSERDGSETVTCPDGGMARSGSVETTAPGPDGVDRSVETQVTSKLYPDGTMITQDALGHRNTTYPEGTFLSEDPDGTRTTHSPDGTVLRQQPDGTVVHQQPNGSQLITSPDGSAVFKGSQERKAL